MGMSVYRYSLGALNVFLLSIVPFTDAGVTETLSKFVFLPESHAA